MSFQKNCFYSKLKIYLVVTIVFSCPQLTYARSDVLLAQAESKQSIDASKVSVDEVIDTSNGGLLTLEQAIDIALSDNPGLAEIQARAEAMAAIPSQVGTLPDPRVSFNAMNLPTDTFDVSQENMTQMQFGISQAIPFPGKLALREEAAEYEAAAALDNVGETRLRLVRNVKVAWWHLFNLDQALNIVLRNQDLLRQFVVGAS